MTSTGGTVMVTGAGGFVGRALTDGFAALGWSVLGLDRDFGGVESHAEVRRVVDLADGVPVGLTAADLIVHGAWITTDPATLGITEAEYQRLNLLPLARVLEFVARSRPTSFVFLSSSGVFAPVDGTDGLRDSDRPTGASPYARAKRAGEALTSAVDGETAVHVVRLGYLYGPGEASRPTRQGVSRVGRWMRAARSGEPLEVPSDDPRREWTYTPDLAAALERVVSSPPARRPLHVGSPHVLHDSEMAELIAAQVPGATIRIAPADAAVKPPMVPSDVPALQGYRWTDPATGVRALMAEGVAA